MICETVDFLVESRRILKKNLLTYLERAMNLSQVPAQGDAVFLAFSRREEPYIIAQNTS